MRILQKKKMFRLEDKKIQHTSNFHHISFIFQKRKMSFQSQLINLYNSNFD